MKLPSCLTSVSTEALVAAHEPPAPLAIAVDPRNRLRSAFASPGKRARRPAGPGRRRAIAAPAAGTAGERQDGERRQGIQRVAWRIAGTTEDQRHHHVPTQQPRVDHAQPNLPLPEREAVPPSARAGRGPHPQTSISARGNQPALERQACGTLFHVDPAVTDRGREPRLPNLSACSATRAIASATIR